MTHGSEDAVTSPCPLREKRSGSERGAALVLVLVLSAIGILVMTTVMYVIMMGTQMSGAEKRYRTAHEAALGAIDVLRPIIQAQAAIIPPGVSITYQGTQFADKIAAPNLESFTPEKIDVEINPLIPNTYDLYVDIGNPVYRVYAKMTQKKPGNTNRGYKQVRIKTGVVPAEPGMGEIHFTYYTFNILAQKAANPNERVRMDLVHIF